MLRKRKEQIISELSESLSRSVVAIATDYRGVSAREMTKLRRKLGESGIEYRVVKNTLTRFAADTANKEQMDAFLVGPLAIAFGYDDAVKPAQVLSEYIRSSGSVLRIRGGVLSDRALSPEEVSTLAALPPTNVMISRLIGQLQAPLQGLHNVLGSPLQGLLNLLQGRIRQIEGGRNVAE